MSSRTFRNTDVHRRVWPLLADVDGHTVDLEPGACVELDVPADFVDPHLTPVAKGKANRKNAPDAAQDEPELAVLTEPDQSPSVEESVS